ncbi:MAG TPA: hypothetical protein VFB13_09905 [Reyranella sp.]|jgi:hypothetical protein|nr:hypothetical protein [Reyranella sp.]
MAERTITLQEFAKEFEQTLCDFHYRTPFTLVLGAGASRSAGIPMAGEMERALARLARKRGISLAKRPADESLLSWRFRRVFDENQPDDSEAVGETEIANADGYVATGGQFLRACIRRARHEANIAHLVAAHLSVVGIFNPIVTTNFDDQTLSGFWSLPWSSADTEPHVVYDPVNAAAAYREIAQGTPVVVKAHGHHTTYGMRMLDQQIRQTSGSVRELLRSRGGWGYVVAGYSGCWDDGIMQALSEPTRYREKLIYWMFVGDKPTMNDNIRRICAVNDVRFVRTAGADQAFLYLFAELPTPPGPEDWKWHLNDDLFISFPPGWRPRLRRSVKRQRVYDWILPNLVTLDGKPTLETESWRQFEAARRTVLPLLNTIEELEDYNIIDDCLGEGQYVPAEEKLEKALDRLAESVPIELDWTRRNRRLLKFSLMIEEESGLKLFYSTRLLAALCAVMGHHDDLESRPPSNRHPPPAPRR